MILRRTVLGRKLSLIQSLKHAAITWNWKLDSRGYLRVPGAKLYLTPYYVDVIYSEWRTWQKHYLPPFSLKDKTVLDVGAGCGESAYFFFRNGAFRVVATEADHTLIPYLERNGVENDWNMEIIARPFELSMLSPQIDWMKMDIEGGESLLSKADSIPPCVIEVHNRNSLQMLLKRFDLQLLTPFEANIWLVTGPVQKIAHDE